MRTAPLPFRSRATIQKSQSHFTKVCIPHLNLELAPARQKCAGRLRANLYNRRARSEGGSKTSYDAGTEMSHREKCSAQNERTPQVDEAVAEWQRVRAAWTSTARLRVCEWRSMWCRAGTINICG